MATNYNPWEEMFKAGQKMMENWTNMAPKTDANTDTTGFNFSNYQDFLKYQQAWIKNWQDAAQNWQNLYKGMETHSNLFQGPYEAWTNMVNGYNPLNAGKFMSSTTRDVYEKMLESNKLYLGLYEQWKKLNEEFLKPGAEGFKKNFEENVEKFNQTFTSNLLPLLPEELQNLVNETQSYYKTYSNTLQNFIGPWAGAYQNIFDIFAETVYKDPNKASDAIKAWKSAYDETFGVLVKYPVVGSTREMLEQNNRAIDALVEMLVTVAEYISKSLSLVYSNSQKAFEEYIDELEKGETPKTFKEFYDGWSKKIEDAIEEYFYTDEFSKLIANTADSAMVFKIEFDKVIEKLLADTPIVTTSKVDNVYKNVHDLKNQVKSLKKEISNLKEELTKAKAADTNKPAQK